MALPSFKLVPSDTSAGDDSVSYDTGDLPIYTLSTASPTP